MRQFIYAFVIAMLLAVPVHGQNLKVVSRLTLYTGTGLDLTSTIHMQRYGYREWNPIIGQHPAQQIAVGVGFAFVTDFLATRYIEPKRPRVATVLRFLGGGVHITAAVYNWSRPR